MGLETELSDIANRLILGVVLVVGMSAIGAVIVAALRHLTEHTNRY